MRPSLRALLRWGSRSVLRERRRYVLMTLTLAVVAAVMALAGMAGWHSTQPVEGATGSAQAELDVVPAANRPLDAAVRAARRQFPKLDVSYRGSLTTPGVSGDLRPLDRDLRGVLGGTPFKAVDGRYPRRKGEIAVTPGLAELLREVDPGLAVGSTLTTRTQELRVVGLVRDPGNYDSLAAYVAPGTIEKPVSAVLLVDAPQGEIFDFADAHGVESFGEVGGSTFNPFAVFALAGAALALLLTVLVSSLSYVISAQRRLREFGLLSAVGATRRQVRFAVLASALFVGVSGAALGTLAGVLLSASVAVLVRHDVHPDPRQWAVLPFVFAVVVVASVAGALQPARTIGRIPVADALSARRPRRQASRGMQAAGLALLLAAPPLLTWALREKQTALAWLAPVLLLLALCLLAPTVTRAAGRWAPRAFALRYATRDLARQGQRAAMSLAALTVILAIPMTLFAVLGSADAARERQPPNLPPNVLILREAASADAGQVLHRRDQPQPAAQAALSRIRALVPGARVTPVHVPVDPTEPLNTSELGAGVSAFESMRLDTKRPRDKERSEHPAWIASPQLLAAWSQPPLGAGDADALSVAGERVRFPGTRTAKAEALSTTSLRVPEATDMAPVWLNPGTAKRLGLSAELCCWMVVAQQPIADELKPKLIAAAGRDYVVMLRNREAAPPPLRLYALAVGLPVSLILLLLALAAGRAEGAAELRLLGTIGASHATLRGIAASQAVVVSLAAAAAATCAAYFAWLTFALASLQTQPLVVPLELVAMLVGLPALAAAIAATSVRGEQAVRRASP